MTLLRWWSASANAVSRLETAWAGADWYKWFPVVGHKITTGYFFHIIKRKNICIYRHSEADTLIHHYLETGLWRARFLSATNDYKLVKQSREVRVNIFCHKEQPENRKSHGTFLMCSNNLFAKHRICIDNRVSRNWKKVWYFNSHYK